MLHTLFIKGLETDYLKWYMNRVFVLNCVKWDLINVVNIGKGIKRFLWDFVILCFGGKNIVAE